MAQGPSAKEAWCVFRCIAVDRQVPDHTLPVPRHAGKPVVQIQRGQYLQNSHNVLK